MGGEGMGFVHVLLKSCPKTGDYRAGAPLLLLLPLRLNRRMYSSNSELINCAQCVAVSTLTAIVCRRAPLVTHQTSHQEKASGTPMNTNTQQAKCGV